MQLQGKQIVVVGAGRSGISVARFAARRGARVILTDSRPSEAIQLPAGLDDEATLELGGHRIESFLAADMIVLSPGVPPAIPEVRAALQHGVEITGEIELAARHLRCPLVGITGTNGKSTVTSLCGEIARASGRPAFVGGNLGTPLIEAVDTPADSDLGIAVVELSSFQLETCETLHPRSAALLNVTPDHLDRYPSMTAYADAKMRIARRLGRDDVFVVNQDDPLAVEALERHGGGEFRVLSYTVRGRPTLTEHGGYLHGDDLVLRLPDEEGTREERYPFGDLALIGLHNLGNALAAYLLMRGVELARPEQVSAGARAFHPLPHRMELAGERGGVRYYDDSKGTNVAAVVASLDGFPRPFVLIAGGRDKGGSYGPLREMLQRNTTRAVVLIGEAAEAIGEAVAGVAVVHRAASMEEAVRLSASLAREGDAVVLSPACSSFDMFDNYGHRGRAFCAAVEALR